MRQCAAAGSPLLPRLRERRAPGHGAGYGLHATVTHVRTAHITMDSHSGGA